MGEGFEGTEAVTIHVVDDEPGIRHGLERLLRASGFEVATYASAEEFLVCANDEGCVVLDFEMPGMSGLELQKELAARGTRWQIVFLSGRYDVITRERQPAMNAGAVAVLEKPTTARQLLAALDVALDRLGITPPPREEPPGG
jgi:two-component system response regulator FixJ